MSLVHYQPTILQGTTKLGKITCGADGYYDMLAGGFDAYNSAGAFYDWNSAKPHFDNSSHFMRRVSSNALFGEDGHPTRIPGWTNDEWIVRILTVDPDRKSHHIKEIYIDPKGFKNKDGKEYALWVSLDDKLNKIVTAPQNSININQIFGVKTTDEQRASLKRGNETKIEIKGKEYLFKASAATTKSDGLTSNLVTREKDLNKDKSENLKEEEKKNKSKGMKM